MNKTSFTKTLKYLVRALVSFALFFALNNICQLIFNSNSFGMEDAPPSAAMIANFLLSVLLFLIFQSVYFTLAVNDSKSKKEFLEQKADYESAKAIVKLVFSKPSLYIETAVFAVLSALLPLNLTYAPVSNLLFAAVESSALCKLFTLLVALPLLFLLTAFAQVSVRKEFVREENKQEKDADLIHTVKSIIVVVMVFLCAAFIIPWFLPGLVTLWNLFGGMLFLWLPLIIIVVVGAIFAYSYIRAIIKCKKFMKSLSEICKCDGYSTSTLPKPCSIMRKASVEIDFSVVSPKATYDCKIISGAFRNSPIVFSDKGNGLRQITFRAFRAELFHIMTKFEYGFESENKKILIVLPMPRNIYASVAGSPPRHADNGERIGEYTLYSASAFLNMLDREGR